MSKNTNVSLKMKLEIIWPEGHYVANIKFSEGSCRKALTA